MVADVQAIAAADRRFYLLFPLTYPAHIAEEYWGGFPAWLSHNTPADLTPEKFLILNAIFWTAMTGAVLVAWYRPRVRWLIATLAVVVIGNALLHAGSTLVTSSYSPGVVTGLLLWLPLGVYALRQMWAELTGTAFALGVLTGIGAQVIVSLLALYS